MKRVALFLATNIAVLVVISIVFNLLGLEPILSESTGLNLTSLLVFSALIGFGGSLISLLLSKKMALWQTRARVIDQPRSSMESWLLNTVHRQADAAGIGRPDVAIYESPEINAFATGASRNNALVAVSTGLLNGMSSDEVEAVLGHEVSHVANGDMVTLTLIQGVLNTFVIFLSRIVGYVVDRVVLRNEGSGPGIGYFVVSIAAQILFGILAAMIVSWFSRQREFRADAGGARLASTGKMVAALERLKRQTTPQHLPQQLSAFGIAGSGARDAMRRLFMSHPPLDERIAALQARGF